MLIHIVCSKYKPEVPDEQRNKHRHSLAALPSMIDDIVRFNVGADILHLERSFDTGLIAVFPDRDALDRYTDHSEHQKVAAMGRELSQQVVSVDFMDE
jgi:hypothetical protein